MLRPPDPEAAAVAIARTSQRTFSDNSDFDPDGVGNHENIE